VRSIFKIFSIVFVFIFFSCTTTTNRWILSRESFWKKFLKTSAPKSKCLFIKGYLDFYSKKEAFRITIYSKVDKNNNLSFQLCSPIGGPIFVFQKNKKEVSFYNVKENILYIADPCYNLLSHYFNINSPFDLTVFFLLIKKEFSEIFIDYYPITQYEYLQKIKFIFQNKMIRTIIWDRKTQEVEILGEYDKNSWRVILKNFDKIYHKLFFKYKDVEIKIKILKEKFLDECDFQSLNSMFFKKTKTIYLKEGSCGKKRKEIFRSF